MLKTKSGWLHESGDNYLDALRIQPGRLQAYVRDAVQGRAGDDGLLQRFGLLVWPDVAKEWRNIDRAPDMVAQRAAFETFRRVAAMMPRSMEDTRAPSPRFYRFSDDAQLEFDAWRIRLEHSLRSSQSHPAVESHLAKYRKLVPAIALVCAVADGEAERVSLSSLRRAVLWEEYLKSHVLRTYGSASRSDVSEAMALLDKIRAQKLKDCFSVRDIYTKGWAQLKSPDLAYSAVETLCASNHLKRIDVDPSESGGRPTAYYRVNPRSFPSG